MHAKNVKNEFDIKLHTHTHTHERTVLQLLHEQKMWKAFSHTHVNTNGTHVRIHAYDTYTHTKAKPIRVLHISQSVDIRTSVHWFRCQLTINFFSTALSPHFPSTTYIFYTWHFFYALLPCVCVSVLVVYAQYNGLGFNPLRLFARQLK